MNRLLNLDWNQYPQLGYCTSQLLAGAILVERRTTMIINTIKPYSRDSLLDAHHEKKKKCLVSSLPCLPDRYGYLIVYNITIQDEHKLIIGTHPCNLLVTSSFWLDTVSVNMGSTTSHFSPSNNTKVYRLVLPSTSPQAMPSLYVLKRVRIKFDGISTYTQCRASSSIASRLEYQPVTIWTLCDQETNRSHMSQEKMSSLLFREVANQVIIKGNDARLNIAAVKNVIGIDKKVTSAVKIIQNIQGLFEEDQQNISIIGNEKLNNHLIDLANIINNKKENEKRRLLTILKSSTLLHVPSTAPS